MTEQSEPPAPELPADLDDHSPEWALVDGTPTPGSPSAIRDAAADLDARAGRARVLVEQWQQMGRDFGDAGWEGTTAEAFMERYTELGGRLQALAEGLHASGSVLQRWADTVAAGKSLAADRLQELIDAGDHAANADTARHRLRLLGAEHAREGDDVAARIMAAAPAGAPFSEDLFHATLRRMGLDADAILGGESPAEVGAGMQDIAGLDPQAAAELVSVIAAGVLAVDRAGGADGPRRLGALAAPPTGADLAVRRAHDLSAADDVVTVEVSVPDGWISTVPSADTIHVTLGGADADGPSVADALLTVVAVPAGVPEDLAVLRAALRVADRAVDGGWRDDITSSAVLGDRPALVRTGSRPGPAGAREHHQQVLVVADRHVVVADFATPDGAEAEQWDALFTSIASSVRLRLS